MSENRDDEGDGLGGLFRLGVVVIAVWLVAWGLVVWFLPDWSQRGTFGDMFGAVNSLFAGLAFAGVIYTILLQQRELALQREEMRLARIEAARIARSSSQAAEIASLAELSRYYRSTMSTAASEAYSDVPDSASPTGSTREVIDEDSDIVFHEASSKYHSVISRLETIRGDISGEPLEGDDGFFDET